MISPIRFGAFRINESARQQEPTLVDHFKGSGVKGTAFQVVNFLEKHHGMDVVLSSLERKPVEGAFVNEVVIGNFDFVNRDGDVFYSQTSALLPSAKYTSGYNVVETLNEVLMIGALKAVTAKCEGSKLGDL